MRAVLVALMTIFTSTAFSYEHNVEAIAVVRTGSLNEVFSFKSHQIYAEGVQALNVTVGKVVVTDSCNDYSIRGELQPVEPEPGADSYQQYFGDLEIVSTGLICRGHPFEHEEKISKTFEFAADTTGTVGIKIIIPPDFNIEIQEVPLP